MKLKFLLTYFSITVLFLTASNLFAEVHFCNKVPDDDINLSIVNFDKEKGVWVSKGWYLVRPGRCLVYDKPTPKGWIYSYSMDKRQRQLWVGAYPFCTSNKPFKIEHQKGKPLCKKRGYRRRLFNKTEVGNAKIKRLDLLPVSGEMIDAILYRDAPIKTLKEWSAEGDTTALKMLRLKTEKFE